MTDNNGAAPGASLSASEKYNLITSNLQEVLNKEIIEEVLNKNERPLHDELADFGNRTLESIPMF